MGTSRSGKEVAGKFRAVADDMKAAQGPALNAAALAAKNKMVAAPGAPRGTVKGAGKKGSRVGVRYKIVGNVAYVRWFGPAHLVNNPTKPHFIGLKSARVQRRIGGNLIAALAAPTGGKRLRKTKAATLRPLKIGGDFAMWAKHPGTRGKRFFQRSRPQAEKAAARAGLAKLAEPLRKRVGA